MPRIADLEVASEVSTADTAERTAADASDLSPISGEPVLLEMTPTEGGHTVSSPSAQSAESLPTAGPFGLPPGMWGDSPETHLSGHAASPLSDLATVGGPPGLWTGALDFGTLDAPGASGHIGDASPAPAAMGPPGVWDTSVTSLSYYTQLAEADTAATLLAAAATPTLGSLAHDNG